ncbi:MAG: stage V sporulation protein AD [Ruminococcus sp.]|nr:stage V sporulation protein AD [Ruminococcus sp.]
MIKRTGKYTLCFEERPRITGCGSAAGKKESQGPLSNNFDKLFYDAYMGQKTFEKAESLLQQEALVTALNRAGKKAEDIDFVFAGDLLNQCIGSSFGVKDFDIPYLGQYGACSTMAQSLIMAAVMVESGAAGCSACVTSSHFCTAERQYRFPLEYGGQRTPTAQWTVTGAGACVLEKTGKAPYVAKAAVGRIADLGVSDLNNMGAAMAPAAAETISGFFIDTDTRPRDYDRIFTGDLGYVGSKCMYELMGEKGFDIKSKHSDCGLMIFDRNKQDVHSGGSGCGCAATVLCSTILPDMIDGKYNNILFIATGALMSPTSAQQGETIPAIAHLVNIRI